MIICGPPWNIYLSCPLVSARGLASRSSRWIDSLSRFPRQHEWAPAHRVLGDNDLDKGRVVGVSVQETVLNKLSGGSNVPEMDKKQKMLSFC